MTTELLTERHGATLLITLSGPATRNALSTQVFAAGIETLNMAESNPDVGAVVLTGAGGHFCSGADLQHFLKNKHNLSAQGAQIDAFNQWIEALRSFPKPVIAAVEGLAAGSGLALVMACDLVVAAETARFSAHPQQTPLTPDGGLSHTLVQALGRARALEVLWQGSPLSAQQWHQWGAAQKLVPGGTAVQAAIEWGEDLARLPASVVSSIKELVNDAPHQSLRAQMTAEKQHALINLAQGQVPGHSAD
ncbi:MAG: enoyl-CoA hydratase/isomerase family protein [Aquabacterium sp.]|jgi:enoyl-CoA hydratase/carnithine racemase|nr:enoyl-CoA hydratase/isomerase family protein [Aquabacterium sp.]MCC7544488.1 enoyl-CoA hydratase/isomerase family protein [Aquabacterium sp.]